MESPDGFDSVHSIFSAFGPAFLSISAASSFSRERERSQRWRKWNYCH